LKGELPWRVIPNRISISGTRGKTSLAFLVYSEIVGKNKGVLCKITGTLPLMFINKSTILMKRKGPAKLYENVIPTNIGKLDYCIMENQGISVYTMKVFHEVFLRPQTVVLTNIRLDHVENLGKTREKIASAISSTITKDVRLVLSGETDERINQILKKGYYEFDVVYSPKPELPGSEIPVLGDYLLRRYGFSGIDVWMYLRKIESELRWKETRGLVFYDGSKINDPNSASLVLRWLGGVPLIILQLRRDRPGRTWAFLKMIRERWVDYNSVIVSGDWSDMFAKKTNGISLPDSCEGASKALEIMRERGIPAFLTGSRGGKFIRCLLEMLGVKGIPLVYGELPLEVNLKSRG